MSGYELFNLLECLTWISFGLYFGVRLISAPKHHRLLFASLTLGFILFGTSDYCEAFTAGHLPWWLWLWKILNGIILFALLIWQDYLNRGRIALAPWRFIAATVILLLAVHGIAQS